MCREIFLFTEIPFSFLVYPPSPSLFNRYFVVPVFRFSAGLSLLAQPMNNHYSADSSYSHQSTSSFQPGRRPITACHVEARASVTKCSWRVDRRYLTLLQPCQLGDFYPQKPQIRGFWKCLGIWGFLGDFQKLHEFMKIKVLFDYISNLVVDINSLVK